MSKFKISIIILSIFILSSCGYDPYEKPEEVTILLNENIFEIYDNHTSNELISNINTDIISKDTTLKNDELGTYTYTLEYLYKKKKYKYDISYEIKDTTKPIFINANKNITIEKGKTTDICQKITYADNYDNLPTCNVIGIYDLNKTGTYNNLKFIIEDRSGNTDEREFNLTVVNKINNSPSYTKPKYLYINDIKKYKNESTSIGIDVSKWQGKVDFKKVKNAGIEFVIMRMGSWRDQKDEIVMDPKFNEYYRLAKEAGLKIGVYIYNVSKDENDGIKTAKWILDNLNGKKIDFPIAYDWEDWSNFMSYQVSMHTLSMSYLAFEKTLKESGYDAMLYSSKYYLENVWMHLENSKVWLAHYTNKTDYKGNYMMWQMTSLAKIDGITENTVDIDILYLK